MIVAYVYTDKFGPVVKTVIATLENFRELLESWNIVFNGHRMRINPFSDVNRLIGQPKIFG